MKLVNARIILLLAMLALAFQVDPISSSFESAPSLLRGTVRLLGGTYQEKMTCNKYPRVCRVKGSAVPDCCKAKCVNVKTDKLNCGMCSNKCAHQETCCNGRCVDTFRDRKHCGGCATKCNKGDICYYGMCSYA